jgi:hypothetical protein
MRSAGFPCRIVGCERAFQVTDQTSMDALKAASALRTAHEVEDHNYHHVPLSDVRPVSPYLRSKADKGSVAKR